MSIREAHRIASLFDLPEPIKVSDFADKGNINWQTYLVSAGPRTARSDYILQQLNPDIFKQPAAVMDAMVQCILAQEQAISGGALQAGEEWETVRLVPTKEGKLFLEMGEGPNPECWRMMVRISNARSYKSLREIPGRAARMKAAEEAGRGLAVFGLLTSGMDPSRIRCSLPGYRDTALYYMQLHSVLAGCRTPSEAASFLPGDTVVRQSTEHHFLIQIPQVEYRRRLEDEQIRRCIDIALEQKSSALKLASALSSGEIRGSIIHGDTKLENFLFSRDTRKVKAIVDLDTVMPHTWLSDWGDMSRSLINPAGEKETDLSKIKVDMEVFEAAARGFLRSARHVAPNEIKFMVASIQTMILELGVRFLADYLRGDSYFRLSLSDNSDLNKIRALVQFRLWEEVRSRESHLERIIADQHP
jgi:hypothetical protein